MPLFSVIIPTYNRAALLGEALDSVFAQTFTDYEVIVVDDGSTDETANFLAAYSDRVRVFLQKNQGPGAARNLGIANARGEYVAFLDSDDVWFPWTLAIYAHVLRTKNSVRLLVGKAFRFSTPEEIQSQTESPVQVSEYRDFLTAGQKPVFFGSNYATVNRNLLLNAGGYVQVTRVFEDQDLGIRLGTRDLCAVVESPVTVGYRQTPGSLTASSSQAFDGVCYLIKNEKAGIYPGGTRRKWERRNYIAFSIRSLSFCLLQEGKFNVAWALYRQAFLWHLRLGRFRYATGFPLLLAMRLVRRRYAN